MLVVAMAALVLVLLSVWLLDPRVTGTPGDSTAPAFNVAEQSQALRDRMAALRAEQQENFVRPELSRSSDVNRQASADSDPDAGSADPSEDAPTARDRQPLTVQAAQALRRQALLNELKREDFARMASLTPEEALAVLEQRPITPEAVLGATQFLDAGDAVSVLEEAITQNPDNPYLRAALASRQGELGNVDAQLAALKSWGDLDPQNGLPLYEMADTLFAQGDVEGGMQALRAAGQRPYSTPYAVDTARYHEAALSASGMESDVSRYFAASVAGNEEYARLANLQQSLLAQGEALEASGDLAGAADVYDAVRDMGQQLAGAASLPSVLQAGYEAELAAVDYLAGIPEILTPDTLNALSTVFDTLWQGLTQAIELTQSMNDLLDTPNTQDLEQTITDILTGTFLNPPG
jgi:tetratricopeptide (TPR) repeat protein